MSDAFDALVVRETDDGRTVAVESLTDDDLPDGDVLVAVEHSSLNYKDGLALTGASAILRKFPMVPGIDAAGSVVESRSSEFSPGDRVVVTGWGIGERHWGGYTQRQRFPSQWLVHLPEAISTRAAMQIGTAGLTAMLCVMALEDGGVEPAGGPVVVTGAAGGVGSVAVAILGAKGYEVTAVTGRPETHDYLRSLGATAFLDRQAVLEAARPLESETWAGAIDTAGSTVLAKLLAQMAYGATVAATGLAAGTDLTTTVMPFVLRNVRLQGVDSVQCPTPRRVTAWNRLATELPQNALATMTEEIGLAELPAKAEDILAGRIRGRVIVTP